MAFLDEVLIDALCGAVLGVLHQRGVELDIERVIGGLVLGGDGGVHPLDEGGERGALPRGAGLGEPGAGKAGEHGAEVVILGQLRGVDLADEGAAAGARHHEAGLLQRPPRFAHRTAADAERIGEGLLVETVAGFDLPFQDPPLELVIDDSRERLAAGVHDGGDGVG